MEIPIIYSVLNKTDTVGIGSYHSPRFYEQTHPEKKKAAPVKPPHKKSFINEIIQHSKSIPASNSYFQNPEKKEGKKPKYTKKIDFDAEMKKGTKTFLDDLIKFKSKVPGVGKYETVKDNTEEIKLKFKIRNDKIRKDIPSFRQTDSSNDLGKDSLRTGPGKYFSYQVFTS